MMTMTVEMIFVMRTIMLAQTQKNRIVEILPTNRYLDEMYAMNTLQCDKCLPTLATMKIYFLILDIF